MPRYRVDLSAAAERELRKADLAVRPRLAEALRGLADNPRPHGSIKMAGPRPRYRVRVGDYRIVYEIADHVLIVTVLRIGNRREVYR